MSFETYEEPVGRYTIVKHETYPIEHQAAMRLNGIDPDTRWDLIWSFNDEQAAIKCLGDCILQAHKIAEKFGFEVKSKFRLIDHGAPFTIIRQAFF